ncbi:alpha-galactosidase [Aliagarivorans taiwanensis]|uniref:alpha-galactosidase n=1 Tax=Aliagarivorans taiwanensis TaxID=561966 RepID=UPI0004257D60|nr:alpha-galactosidase [Aliagarivorans taiwanensis]
MAQSLVHMRGCHTEVILEIGDYAEILYWGKRLNHPPEQLALALKRPVPYGRLDKDVSLSLHPELARGVFSSPGLEGHRDGLDWAPAFTIEQVQQQPHYVVLVSVDKRAGLRLRTELVLEEDDVLKVRHQLFNDAKGDYQVTRLASTLPVPERAEELMSYYGRWVHEFQQQRHSLQHGGYIQENRRGRTSHEHYPAFVTGSRHFGETSGEVWGFHLAWSGNHRMRADVKTDGRRMVQGEALYLPGEISLSEGESLTTPWLYASYSDQGLNGMSAHFHQHVREQILAKRLSHKARPIHLNTWEGIYFDHDPSYIMKMASESAEMGVERFIIDDGWFKGRNGDKAALGDWFLDEQKYPEGLGKIVEHVNKLGMEFGLWFEPEMINKDSDLYRSHPEWLLGVEGYEQPTGRNQYAINLQIKEAFDYLFERLDHFLSHYNIAYIKWDMNREIVQPGHHGRAAGQGQVEAYYRLVDKLAAKHPQVEIESCAAGGGRIDFEVLKRTHRFWTSDNNDALERQTIQRGMSYFFPPEVMGSHIGASHCHSTRRRHTINFRGLTALFGHMGIELDPVRESAEEKQGFVKYIELHKRFRPLLHSGKSFRIPVDDELAQMAHGVVCCDRTEALVMVAQTQMPTHSLSSTLRIPGLNPLARYKVRLIDHPENLFEGLVACQPAWTEQGVELTGEWLERAGLAMPIMDSESAVLVHIQQL